MLPRGACNKHTQAISLVACRYDLVDHFSRGDIKSATSGLRAAGRVTVSTMVLAATALVPSCECHHSHVAARRGTRREATAASHGIDTDTWAFIRFLFLPQQRRGEVDVFVISAYHLRRGRCSAHKEEVDLAESELNVRLQASMQSYLRSTDSCPVLYLPSQDDGKGKLPAVCISGLRE